MSRDSYPKQAHAQRRESLPPAHRAMFDAARARMGVAQLARALGVADTTIHALDYGGKAKPETIAKVCRALDDETVRSAS